MGGSHELRSVVNSASEVAKQTERKTKGNKKMKKVINNKRKSRVKRQTVNKINFVSSTKAKLNYMLH